MRVLDLDLDCFVSRIVHFASDAGKRPSGTYHRPWSENRFRSFLEQKCGLSTRHPVRGRIFTEHKEAFFYWRDLLTQQKLVHPFAITHVDAHSDMGLGESSWAHIMSELLFLKVEERQGPKEGPHRLTSGSYMAYALACRWFSEVTFVHHVDWPDHDDLMRYHFKNYNTDSGILQMKAYRHDDLTPYYLEHNNPTHVEPEVPFVMCSIDEYDCVAPFDTATLCQSPGFTPRTADVLLDVFREYVSDT